MRTTTETRSYPIHAATAAWASLFLAFIGRPGLAMREFQTQGA